MKNLKFTVIIILFFTCMLTVTSCKDDDGPQAEICNDGIDNDGDGFVDCADFDCAESTEIECNCNDGIDNDGDGFTDCDDFDCEGNSNC